MKRPDAIQTTIATHTMSTTMLHDHWQQALLLEAAAGVHAGQEVIPAEAPVFHGELLLVDEVLQLGRFPEGVRSRR